MKIRTLRTRERAILVGGCLAGVGVSLMAGSMAVAAALVFLAAWLQLGQHLSAGAIGQTWAGLLGRRDVLIVHACVFDPDDPGGCLAAIDTTGEVRHGGASAEPGRFMDLLGRAQLVLAYDVSRTRARIGVVAESAQAPVPPAKWRCLANDYRTVRAGRRVQLEQALQHELPPPARLPGRSAVDRCVGLKALMHAVCERTRASCSGIPGSHDG